MNQNDASYYLKRIRFHREMRDDARCIEALICHHQLVKAYQRRLKDIRASRSRSVSVRTSAFGWEPVGEEASQPCHEIVKG